jgi:hypothetical protein
MNYLDIWSQILRTVKAIPDEGTIRELEAQCIERCVEIIGYKCPSHYSEGGKSDIENICKCIRSGGSMPGCRRTYFVYPTSDGVPFLSAFGAFLRECESAFEADKETHRGWLLQLLSMEKWAYDPGYDAPLAREQLGWLTRQIGG